MTRQLAIQFEHAVLTALQEISGVEVSVENSHLGVDFVLRKKAQPSVTTFVEVKLYTSRLPSRPLLQKAIDFLDFKVSTFQADIGFLITNFEAGAQARSVVDLPERTNLMGLDDLLALVQHSPIAYAGLLEVAAALRSERHDYSEQPPSPSRFFDTDFLTSPPPSIKHHAPLTTPLKAKGAQICDDLKEIPAGRDSYTSKGGVKKAAWRHFEDKCEEALRYIFEDQLHQWESQSGPDDGIHKYDLLAKIMGDQSPWQSLIVDFRSRYIVFEFKNYLDKIGQNTIYVTEKYLYPTALRSTAILVSREGPDESAVIACKGALRDSGKLIMNLTIEDFCEMLHMRDAGDEPSQHLTTLLDRLLRNIDR